MAEQQKNNQAQEELKKKNDFDKLLKDISKKLKSREQRIFETVYEIAEKLLDKGYAKAWFLWLEWLILTSALLAIAIKTGSIIASFLAFGSGMLLFFIGLVSINRVFAAYISKEKLEKRHYILAIITVYFGVILIILTLLSDVLGTAFFK